jgi:hypothetical protein
MDLTEKQREQLKHDYSWYARNFFNIVATNGDTVKLAPRLGQNKLYAAIEKQRKAGLPIRVRVLKARKIGFSTSSQQILVQRATTRANHFALTVAHDKTTAAALFNIGNYGFERLPNSPLIKPTVASWSDTAERKYLRFGETARNRRILGHGGLNSSYQIDTANEYESGRGLTINSLHGSETAFWKQQAKLLALFNAVPDDPDSIIIDESTANGFNFWQELWQDSEDGISSFVPVFVGWWEEPTYSTPFVNDDDEQEFIDKEIGHGPYGEEEEYLIAEFGCTPQQLNWRRKTIVDKCQSDVEKFNQEYPATPEHAFIASGRTVFAKHLLRRLKAQTKKTDAPLDEEGDRPDLGILKNGDTTQVRGRTQMHEVPTSSLWVPSSATGFPEDHAFWRKWAEPQKTGDLKEEGRYIVACDPAGDPSPDPKKSASHAVVVIDHKTGKQMAELETWIDTDLLTEEIMRAAVYYNDALIAVETTGGYGFSIVHKLHRDYHYRHVYVGARLDTKGDEEEENRLGWNSSRASKTVMEDTMRERLRTNTHGIQSSRIASQMFNYVNLGNGKTGAEKNKRTDLVMALQIAHQIKQEEEPRPQLGDFVVVSNDRPFDPRTGW